MSAVGRRRWSVWLIVALLATPFIANLPSVASANGGQIRMAGKRLGPYEVTVFTSPTPLQVTTVDVSALIQDPKSAIILSNVRIWVTAQPPGAAHPAMTYEATRAQATNKLFYAANFKLPTSGTWRFSIKVVGPAGQGEASFSASVSKLGLFHLPSLSGHISIRYWVVGVLAVLLVGAGGWWFFWGTDGDEPVDDASTGARPPDERPSDE